MLKIENLKAFGIMEALRGMRNPLNSWDKLDSTCRCSEDDGHVIELKLGPNDAKLCSALINGGAPHRKFLRQIHVTMDITAPAYWWAEMDTYKISTTRDSCSVQHKGASRDFTLDDFTIDKILEGDGATEFNNVNSTSSLKWYSETFGGVLGTMNHLRKLYNDTKDYKYFRLLRQIMPMGYNYKATWSGTYEVLLNIYQWRRNHKLIEWHRFCAELLNLPGAKEFLSTQRNGDA